jgi:hypothetical protein
MPRRLGLTGEIVRFDAACAVHTDGVSGVLVALSAAVVKTAFGVWTGDNALAGNVSDELTDLIAGQVSDARDRQKVANRFASIAEIVGDRVAATLREEFRNVSAGEQDAAIFAVTQTLGRADLTDIGTASRAVFAAGLDAATLERSVRRLTGDATRDLSAAATDLYNVVLSQCCASIVEIADKLPRFQANAFATLLSRDAMILERIEEVLARLPMPSPEADGSDQVEVDYRRIIAKDFDRLQLFGLDFAAQWYPLSIAYVSLTMSARPPADEEIADHAGLASGERSFEEWLRACPRLLIEGRAGGGKTTLLQWIAVRAALRDFAGPAADYSGYVPFFLRLRQYVGRPLPTPEEFLDSAAPVLRPEAGTWPSKQLRAGKAFVLVDGLDEVPEAQRPDVIAWLGQLVGAFPEARYVVTSRPGAIEPGGLAHEGFATADLEPMTPTLVRVFVDRWHAAMRGFHQDTAALERLADCQAELLRTLDNDRFVGELANTPLLAGLICALNHYLDGELPRRRGEIYEEALKMFHKRDRRRKIGLDLDLDLDATNHLLSDLALWMVHNARTEVADEPAVTGAAYDSMVTADTAQAVLVRSALSLPSRPPAGADLYRHLLLRSGVLREPTAGHVDFVHRTFQEYLAAKALIRNDSVNELIRNAGDDQWREIVILASGLCATNKQANDLLRGLIKPSWRDRDRYRRRLLAVACLDEIRQADQAVLKQIEEAIPDLLPPRDMAQAEALSHAGGYRLIPHLANVTWSAAYFPFVIRAAALAGGTEALRLLGRLADRERQRALPLKGEVLLPTIPEFMRAWSYFDQERYAEQVIAPLSLSAVEVTDPRCLKSLRNAPAVKHATITGLRADTLDLSGLDGLSLSTLKISDSDIKRLTGTIRNPPRIEQLTLDSCHLLTDIDAIIGLRNLSQLDILDCEQLSNFVEVNENDRYGYTENTIKFRNDPRIFRLAAMLKKLTLIRVGYIGLTPTWRPYEAVPLYQEYSRPTPVKVLVLPKGGSTATGQG